MYPTNLTNQMKHLVPLLCLFCFFSCQKRLVELPEVSKSNITEVSDLSPAYIFYDETLPDSVELNRKNLIISTNWIVNVDKRLTLEQVIPKIQILQNKRRNTEMHKNENAKDYYSCNDTSIKNLGFLEFTHVDYILGSPSEYKEEANEIADLTRILLDIHNPDAIAITYTLANSEVINTNAEELLEQVNEVLETVDSKTEIVLSFNKNLSFQEYINIKSLLSELTLNQFAVNSREFIY